MAKPRGVCRIFQGESLLPLKLFLTSVLPRNSTSTSCKYVKQFCLFRKTRLLTGLQLFISDLGSKWGCNRTPLLVGTALAKPSANAFVVKLAEYWTRLESSKDRLTARDLQLHFSQLVLVGTLTLRFWQSKYVLHRICTTFHVINYKR